MTRLRPLPDRSTRAPRANETFTLGFYGGEIFERKLRHGLFCSGQAGRLQKERQELPELDENFS